MKLQSLSDLSKLLPDSEQRKIQSPTSFPKFKHDGKGESVRVFLDTKGRKGKSVTIVSGLQHNPMTMEDLARVLKQHCGAGGTVKERTIEIQGDQRERVTAKLREMNYNVT
ncbi:MAG: translation initiation factor [Bacteroidota bacterium]|nr:translation initiation factor [Bacteroidota bacterium]